MSIRKIVTTCTRDCPNSCGLIATVEDGRLVRIQGDPEHPFTRGVCCRKTSKNYVNRVYNPERITFPLRKVDGRWQRASWDEVLDIIADKLKSVIRESGPEAVLYYQGYGERTALKLLNKYFFNLLGGVTTLCGSICGGAGQGSQNLDFGNRISHDPMDHYNSNSMILWGRNPVSTNISLVRIVKDIRKRGGKVIVIDPACSKSVGIADNHIRPRPGCDGYLAMAAAKIILDAGAEDTDFVTKRSVGYDEYLTILNRFDIEELCDLAGVPVSDAELIADTLMREKPTSILLGWGLHRHEYAHLSIRPIDALGAISGNIGISGGGVSQGFEEYGPYNQFYWGDSLNPERRKIFIGKVGEEILNATDPEIRMIYITAGNPICMAPNSDKISKAFKKAELVVYSNHFLDDTAEHADIFLPATTYLEEDDFVASYGHNYLGPVNKAIEPLGETKSEFEMFYDLSLRFSFAGEFRKSVDEWLNILCTPIYEHKADLETLREGAFRLDEPMVPYEDGVFETESGKFQFMAEFDPDLLVSENKEYPYKFLTIAPHDYICSERTVAEHDALPVVQLNAEDARNCGVEDSQHVIVKSEFGQLLAVLKINDNQRGGIVVAERGGWNKAGHGVNLLTNDLESKVGRGTAFYETRVAVLPCPQDGPVGMRILVVQHSESSPGGHFTKELERQGCVLTIVMPSKGDSLPESSEGYDRLVVLGGPQHPSDDEGTPHFPALMKLMREFDELSKPVAGICLGCQILARAHGSEVWTMPELEFGFVQHHLTSDGETDPVFDGVEIIPRLMEFHEASFDLPDGATALIEGDKCRNQCFKVGNVSYGFQFHLEMDSITLGHWFEEFKNSRIDTYAKYRKQFTDSFFEEMSDNFSLLVQFSGEFCVQIARNWLRI